MWHTFGHILAKTDTRGAPKIEWTDEAAAGYWSPQPVDWGEIPFGKLSGLAWDGKNLWAIDNATKRICVIEKAKFGLPDSVPHDEIRNGLPTLSSSLGFPAAEALEKEGIRCRVVSNCSRAKWVSRFPAALESVNRRARELVVSGSTAISARTFFFPEPSVARTSLSRKLDKTSS